MGKKLYTVKHVDALVKYLGNDEINPEWIKFASAKYANMGTGVKKRIYDHSSKEKFLNCKKCKLHANGDPSCPYFDWYDSYHKYVEKGKIMFLFNL